MGLKFWGLRTTSKYLQEFVLFLFRHNFSGVWRTGLPRNPTLHLGYRRGECNSLSKSSARKSSNGIFFSFIQEGLIAPVFLPFNANLTSIKRNNNTYTHYGEMASWQMRGILANLPTDVWNMSYLKSCDLHNYLLKGKKCWRASFGYKKMLFYRLVWVLFHLVCCQMSQIPRIAP